MVALASSALADSTHFSHGSAALKVYAIVPALIPSAVITIIKPFFELRAKGLLDFDFAIAERWTEASIAAADVIIFHRSNSLSDLRALRLAEDSGKPIIYDIDDNLFEISLETSLGRSMRSSLAVGIMDRFVRAAHETRVYSPLMHEAVARRGGRPTLQRAYFEAPAGVETLQPMVKEHVRIAFASARTGGEDIERPMEEALVRIARRYGKGVEFLFWKEPAIAVMDTGRVRLESPIADYKRFLQTLASLQPDIGLAPLGDDRFFRSKTNNKYREYGGLGIAGIYSDIDLYRSCVQDGQTGLLVPNNVGAWESALIRLIESKSLRQQIAAAAARDVAHAYSFELFLTGWQSTISRVAGAPATTLRAVRAKPLIPVVVIPRDAMPRLPLVTRLATLISDLGGHIVSSTSLQGQMAVLRSPRHGGALEVAVPFNEIAIFDLSALDSPLNGELASEISERAFALADSPAANHLPTKARIPDQRRGHGLYDAGGADARLLVFAEKLLDAAPRQSLTPLRVLYLRLRRIKPIMRIGCFLRRVSELIVADARYKRVSLLGYARILRKLWQILRFRLSAANYERRLRRMRRL